MSKLPTTFVSRMKSQFSATEFSDFLEAFEINPTISIRLNSCKPIEKWKEEKSVIWFSNGKYISEKIKFIIDPLWHAGTYYVQEPSSMFLGEIFHQIFKEEKPHRALDLCAAPGGKSTLLQSLLDDNSVLVANEVIKSRAQILKENHIRLGISENLIITQNDPKDFTDLEEFFDYIQVDAPCSGEGMFRKEKSALEQWSEANCQLCSERQKRILADVIPTLAKDGYLVYSTCTFNPHENEKLVAWACHEFDLESVRIKLQKEWNITEVLEKNAYGYYFYPHKVEGEGFFISVLRKNSGYGLTGVPHSKKEKSTPIPYLIESEKIFREKHTIIWESQMLQNVKKFLKKELTILYSGIELGELKRDNFIPSQALANFHQQLHLFPRFEVDQETALDFLRGKNPNLSINQKGIHLLTFQNYGLSFIKYLGNRSNNYYPKPWRIKNF